MRMGGLHCVSPEALSRAVLRETLSLMRCSYGHDTDSDSTPVFGVSKTPVAQDCRASEPDWSRRLPRVEALADRGDGGERRTDLE